MFFGLSVSKFVKDEINKQKYDYRIDRVHVLPPMYDIFHNIPGYNKQNNEPKEYHSCSHLSPTIWISTGRDLSSASR